VLDALREPGQIGWAWSAILIGSLLTILGFARAGSTLFWKSTAIETEDTRDQAATPLQLAPAMVALAMLAGLTIFAGPLAAQFEQTADQLLDRGGYIGAVLGAPDAEPPAAVAIEPAASEEE